MGKDCKHTVPCGCEDTPLTTPTSCEQGTPECPNPDPCPEVFNDACLVHAGDTIVDLNILKGDRMDLILQKIALYLTNPGCFMPGGTCLSVLGLKSTTITSTSVGLSWLPQSTALMYQVEYKQAAALTWTLNPTINPSGGSIELDSITNLLPNTEYHIRVSAICNVGTCYSVTISVKTKP